MLLAFESSMGAVALREPILLNRRFDRMLIPPASVMTEALAFAASFLMFPLAMIYYGVAPTLALLWLPVVVAATLVLALGVAWPAALLGIWLPTTRVFAGQGAAHPVLRRARHRRALGGPGGRPRLGRLQPAHRAVRVLPARVPLRRQPRVLAARLPGRRRLVLTLAFLPLYRREQRHFAKFVRS